jgi:hypothetical protein
MLFALLVKWGRACCLSFLKKKSGAGRQTTKLLPRNADTLRLCKMINKVNTKLLLHCRLFLSSKVASFCQTHSEPLLAMASKKILIFKKDFKI